MHWKESPQESESLESGMMSQKSREAWRRAKAKLKGLYRGDNPTFKEVAHEYRKLTGWQLDRRALKDADCPVRPDKAGRRKNLPRREPQQLRRGKV
jgi:hypothetical protein